MKKHDNDPIAIIVGGLETLLTWFPLLLVLAVMGTVGTAVFAVLWWLRGS